MSTEQIPAIDVHAHYGRYSRQGVDPKIEEFMTASAELVVRRARLANIEWTIASPLKALLPRLEGNPIGGNEEAAATIDNTEGMLQYVVVDPLTPATYDQAAEMLQKPKCVGIKIHPEEHGYPIVEHGRKIFEFAARHRAVVLTHSSEQNSQADDFVPFINDYPEVKLILAHIGHGWDGDVSHQIRAIQRCRHENVFADTSSARSITPGLIEWAVKEVGPERILFGTDTPLYHAPMQRSRIDYADLSDSDKRLILRDNAIRVFNLNLGS
ncbi:amidohydrolase family protein [Schlesneria paludicola]|uniref:amidohydrolase family protein n=1 Tax=Schlesneria paludicola TaxID=360056 RepID=UPI000310557F|nr:amidohydrolase family protein [Schlesneria paludicola]